MFINNYLTTNISVYDSLLGKHFMAWYGRKKKGQPLTLTLNLHMNLPYSFTILSVSL